MLNVLFDSTRERSSSGGEEEDFKYLLTWSSGALLLFCVPEIICVLLKVLCDRSLCNLTKRSTQTQLLFSRAKSSARCKERCNLTFAASFFTFHFVYKKSLRRWLVVCVSHTRNVALRCTTNKKPERRSAQTFTTWNTLVWVQPFRCAIIFCVHSRLDFICQAIWTPRPSKSRVHIGLQ